MSSKVKKVSRRRNHHHHHISSTRLSARVPSRPHSLTDPLPNSDHRLESLLAILEQIVIPLHRPLREDGDDGAATVGEPAHLVSALDVCRALRGSGGPADGSDEEGANGYERVRDVGGAVEVPRRVENVAAVGGEDVEVLVDGLWVDGEESERGRVVRRELIARRTRHRRSLLYSLPLDMLCRTRRGRPYWSMKTMIIGRSKAIDCEVCTLAKALVGCAIIVEEGRDAELLPLDPNLRGFIDRREDGEPTVRCRRNDARIIDWLGNGPGSWLKLAGEEVVEGTVLADVGLGELREGNRVRRDEGFDVGAYGCWVGGVVVELALVDGERGEG